MSKGGRGLSDEEKKLWRRVAAAIKARRALPKEDETRAPSTRAKVSGSRVGKAAAQQPAAPKARAPAPPQNRGAEKRVRRGRLEIGGTLDLHGHNQVSGRAALARFLQAAHRRGVRTVIVVTGVGRAGQGVLKRRLPEWLAEADLGPMVSGFAEAHRAHGGGGAYYVFLRAARTT